MLVRDSEAGRRRPVRSADLRRGVAAAGAGASSHRPASPPALPGSPSPGARSEGARLNYSMADVTRVSTSLGFLSGKDIVLVIGNTGDGKSTLVNYLLGKVMRETRLPNGTLAVECEDTAAARIGHGVNSETALPVAYDFSEGGVSLVDCPGFLDNRSMRSQIDASLSIFLATKKARRVKAVVVAIPRSALYETRGALFRDTARTLAGFVEGIEANSHSVVFVITRNTDSGLRSEQVLRRANEILEGLSEDAEHDCIRQLIRAMGRGNVIVANPLDNGDTRTAFTRFVRAARGIAKSEFAFVEPPGLMGEMMNVMRRALRTCGRPIVEKHQAEQRLKLIPSELERASSQQRAVADETKRLERDSASQKQRLTNERRQLNERLRECRRSLEAHQGKIIEKRAELENLLRTQEADIADRRNAIATKERELSTYRDNTGSEFLTVATFHGGSPVCCASPFHYVFNGFDGRSVDIWGFRLCAPMASGLGRHERSHFADHSNRHLGGIGVRDYRIISPVDTPTTPVRRLELEISPKRMGAYGFVLQVDIPWHQHPSNYIRMADLAADIREKETALAAQQSEHAAARGSLERDLESLESGAPKDVTISLASQIASTDRQLRANADKKSTESARLSSRAEALRSTQASLVEEKARLQTRIEECEEEIGDGLPEFALACEVMGRDGEEMVRRFTEEGVVPEGGSSFRP